MFVIILEKSSEGATLFPRSFPSFPRRGNAELKIMECWGEEQVDQISVDGRNTTFPTRQIEGCRRENLTSGKSTIPTADITRRAGNQGLHPRFSPPRYGKTLYEPSDGAKFPLKNQELPRNYL